MVLVNIGTPTSTSEDDVADYLMRFLGDKPVVDIKDPEEKKAVLRRLIRPKQSAEKYREIWDADRGSPLLFHTQDLLASLQGILGVGYHVCIGFQYSEPSMETALQELSAMGAGRIVLVPMFPHFARATVGAFLANASAVAMRLGLSQNLQVVPPFYKDPGYLQAAQECMAASCKDVDHVVFSFHGVPLHQLHVEEPKNCYRAQCQETAELLAAALGLAPQRWSLAFQSRRQVRGDIAWTEPHLDELLQELPGRGFPRVAVFAVSYTVDCIETLGGIGQDGRSLFLAAGGTELRLVPCLNASSTWSENLARLIREPRRAGAFWAM